MEADLYPAVKAFLEAKGYDVKAEVCGCDVVATRAGEPPLVVEMKLAFSLALLLQGVDRLTMTDRVYLAVARPRKRRGQRASVHRRDVRDLCRRLGLGLMTVAPDRVEVILDAVPSRPRRRRRRLTRLLREHRRRAGDPNRGGITKTPIVTAYRQEALRCALLIERDGLTSLQALRATGVVPNAPRILQKDVYGWFRRVERATYGLTDRARDDLARYTAAGVTIELGASKAPRPPWAARNRPGTAGTVLGSGDAAAAKGPRPRSFGAAPAEPGRSSVPGTSGQPQAIA